MSGYFKPQLEWNLPLSGGVSVPITMPSANGSQIGLFNINLGSSSDTDLEAKMLQSAGSYGKQIGRICDALDVVLRKLDKSKLDKADLEAIAAFECTYKAITKTKARHGGKVLQAGQGTV
jgi:hypothetical protein